MERKMELIVTLQVKSEVCITFGLTIIVKYSGTSLVPKSYSNVAPVEKRACIYTVRSYLKVGCAFNHATSHDPFFSVCNIEKLGIGPGDEATYSGTTENTPLRPNKIEY